MSQDYVNIVALRGAVVDYSETKGQKGDDGYIITLLVRDYEFRVIYYGSANIREFLNEGSFVVVYGALGYHRGALVVKASRILGGSTAGEVLHTNKREGENG